LLRAISRDISQRGTADLAAYARLYPAPWQEVCRLFPAARHFTRDPADTQALRHTALEQTEPDRAFRPRGRRRTSSRAMARSDSQTSPPSPSKWCLSASVSSAALIRASFLGSNC
jgi:hypothetical protein